MLSDMLFRPFRWEKSRAKKTRCKESEEEEMETSQVYYAPFPKDPLTNFSLRSHNNFDMSAAPPTNPHVPQHTQRHHGRPGPKTMASSSSKVSNFSDLVQRVTASCLLRPLAGVLEDGYSDAAAEDEDEVDSVEMTMINSTTTNEPHHAPPRVMELEMLMSQVFDAVSAMKRAYASLQDAHSPWDSDKMRVSDVAVVAELRRLGLLRERFRRGASSNNNNNARVLVGSTLREVVAPYEAAMEELKREVKARQAEVDNLREKLKTASSKPKPKSRRRVSCTTQVAAAAPAVELFEATMSSVKEASKAFTTLLLSLMRSAHWDIAAAVRSIEAASSTSLTFTDSIVGASHAKYALESYLNRKVFQGFDHETFYMDGSLSSILHPDQHRRDCFTQYRDMKAMDPAELLGILPTCSFGNFCFNKYLSIVHPKMEDSLFGDLEQRRQVLDGHHPRTPFYGEFLGLAKAVWLLHLLAFALDPPPSHFEASSGAEFHSQYMESVVRACGGNGGPKPMTVGFPVSPGFKLWNGSIIKARVYLVSKDG